MFGEMGVDVSELHGRIYSSLLGPLIFRFGG